MAEDHAFGARRAATWMVAVNQAESLYAHELARDSRSSTAEFRVKGYLMKIPPVYLLPVLLLSMSLQTNRPKLYIIGGQGGFIGADGVNPIEFLVPDQATF